MYAHYQINHNGRGQRCHRFSKEIFQTAAKTATWCYLQQALLKHCPGTIPKGHLLSFHQHSGGKPAAYTRSAFKEFHARQRATCWGGTVTPPPKASLTPAPPCPLALPTTKSPAFLTIINVPSSNKQDSPSSSDKSWSLLTPKDRGRFWGEWSKSDGWERMSRGFYYLFF